MRDVILIDHAKLLVAERESLRAELASQRTLAVVLAALRAARPPREVAQIVTQDEFTHDVIVAAGRDLWLVFDTT